MSYTNVYPSRINWENEPSIASPINATNLNKIDYAVYEHDQTFETWDVTKANQSDLLLSVKSIDYDTTTGVFVFTWQNGTTKTVDLNIEKIPVSFSMSAQGVITMTTDDGTQYTADVGSLIKTYTFTDSTEIDFTVTTDASGNKTVTAALKDGSIVGTKLEPNYLANCQSAANSASASKTAAEGSAEDSEAWAVGQRDGTDVPSTDPTYHNNAKWYAEHGATSSLAGLTDTDITSPTDGQVLTYNSTSQKWENDDPSAGGGSTIKVTTSESSLYGRTVTITCGTYTESGTFSNSGEVEFTGVTATGNFTITSSTSGGDTATASLSVPYFGNYTKALTLFSATITVTYPSGATCTCNSETATSSPYTFNIGSTGTYTATCTLDGVSKTQSFTITTDGQTESHTFEYGTINVTYDNAFRGLILTCTKSGVTISKTAPVSSNSMSFYPPTTGTWAVAGTYSGVTYSKNATISSLSTAVSVQLQTVIQKSITIYSAKEDTITYKDIYNNTQTVAFASGATNKTFSITVNPNTTPSITFTSSVAKNPSNLSQNYSKTVTLTSGSGAQTIYLMPNNALYWYGYKGNNYDDSGYYHTAYPNTAPTYNTNSVTLNGTSSAMSAIGVNTLTNVGSAIKAVLSNGGMLMYSNIGNKTTDGANVTSVTSSGDTSVTSLSCSGSKYFCARANLNVSATLKALWYE